MRALLAALAACALCACATQRPNLSGAASADVGFAAGTLCFVGSFECEVAPTINHLVVTRHLTAVALKNGVINAQAAKILESVEDRINAQLKEAVRVCAPDEHHHCTGDHDAAVALIHESDAAIARVQATQDHP